MSHCWYGESSGSSRSSWKCATSQSAAFSACLSSAHVVIARLPRERPHDRDSLPPLLRRDPRVRERHLQAAHPASSRLRDTLSRMTLDPVHGMLLVVATIFVVGIAGEIIFRK